MKFFRNLHTEAETVAGDRLIAAANNAAEMVQKPVERRPVHEVTNENLVRTYAKAESRLDEVENEIDRLRVEKAQLEITMKAVNEAVKIIGEFGIENDIQIELDNKLREAFRDDAESVNAA